MPCFRFILFTLSLLPATGIWAQTSEDSLHAATCQQFLTRGNEHPSEDSAIYLYKKGVEYAQQFLAQDHPVLGDLYNKLGITYKYRKEFEIANLFYDLALEARLSRFGDQHSKVAAVYNNLGLLKKDMGKFDQAEHYLLESLKIEKASLGPSHLYIAQSLSNLGLVYRGRGDFDQAVDFLEEALIMKIEVTGPQSHSTSFGYINLGLAYMEAQDYEKSIDHLKKALAITTSKGNRIGQAVAYENLGNTSFLMGSLDSSLYYYQRGLERLTIEKDLEPNTTLTSADFLLNNTSWMVLGGKGRTLLGKYYETNEISYLDKAIANAHLLFGHIMLTLQQISYATSKQSFLDQVYDEFERALLICHLAYLHSGDSRYRDQAFEWSEASRSLLLLESIRSDQAKFQAGLPQAVQEKEEQLSGGLASLKNTLYNASKYNITGDSLQRLKEEVLEKSVQLQNYLDTIKANYPRYHHMVYQGQLASLEAVQDQLGGNNSGFLEFFTGKEHQFAFYVDQDTIIWYHHQSSPEIKQQVKIIVTHLKDPTLDLDAYKQASKQLYQKLIHPIQISSQVDQLMVVRDGVLNYLPFEVLSPDGSNYLFENLAVSYLYSATIGLEQMKAQRTTWEGRYLAFAPNFNQRKSDATSIVPGELVRGSLAELPGTFEEVASISKMLNGQYYEGSSANEQTFKSLSGKYDIIHLATHAIVDEENPMNSRLLFSLSNEQEDGDLYAWELYNMRLNAQMAVLSACNTGAGQLTNGEGVMSLGHAFAYAGCPSIVMSLWPAQDQATAEIMKYFYQGLANNLSKDEALRRAKLTYLKNADDLFAHPFYWAGFVVQGDIRPLTRKTNTPYWQILIICGLFAAAWIFDRKFFNMSLN